MLKKIILIGLLIASGSSLVAKQNSKFKIDELVILPHPGKLFKTGKIVLTQEQKKQFSQEIKSVYPPIFQEKMRAAFQLEKKLQRAVSKGKTAQELKDTLDQIAKLKREAMDGRIAALNHIKKILTKEQWDTIIKLSYK